MATCVTSRRIITTTSTLNPNRHVSLVKRTYDFQKAKNLCIGYMCSGDLFDVPVSRDHAHEIEDEFLLVILFVLLKAVNEGDKQKWSHKYFYAPKGGLPTISLEGYLARIHKFGRFTKESFLRAVIYMDRLREGGFVFNSYNIHRAFLISIVTAAKFFEDQPCDNKYYGSVGGINTAEINALEVQFLFMMDWKLNISAKEYEHYETALKYSSQDYSNIHKSDSKKRVLNSAALSTRDMKRPNTPTRR